MSFRDNENALTVIYTVVGSLSLNTRCFTRIARLNHSIPCVSSELFIEYVLGTDSLVWSTKTEKNVIVK